MFDWSGKNGDKSGKSQGILISCVSGNPDTTTAPCQLHHGFCKIIYQSAWKQTL